MVRRCHVSQSQLRQNTSNVDPNFSQFSIFYNLQFYRVLDMNYGYLALKMNVFGKTAKNNYLPEQQTSLSLPDILQ